MREFRTSERLRHEANRGILGERAYALAARALVVLDGRVPKGVVNTMGFSPQPNEWQCGPYALKYALLALAIPCDETDLTRESGATQQGTDERDLDRAARRHGCVLRVERSTTRDSARDGLRSHLSRRTPVLLCVDQWSHWIVAVGGDADGAVVLDSRRADVIQVMPWPGLMGRVAYRGISGATLYDLQPLVPMSVPPARAEFSRARAEFLLRPANRALRRGWEQYVRALLPLARPKGVQTEWTLPLANVVREVSPRVLGATAGRQRDLLRERLAHATFVADAYDFEIGLDQTEHAVEVLRRLGDEVVLAA